jgi:protein-tyrosine-phosphatase
MVQDKKTILLICSGNTCRSPMAKVILEHKLKERGQLDRFEIDSAAINGTSHSDASENARTVIIKIYGQDLLANHKPKKLTDELTKQADLILAMTGAIKNTLPQGKSWTLKEYAGETGDVADPFGGSLDTYLKCAKEISSLLEKVLPKLK